MGKILVTGASGHIGKLTIEKLLQKKVPSNQIIGLVRDPSKAEDLAKLGIELRQGDYADLPSLLKAFVGVEKLMLISTHAFTDRIKAHSNVVHAAVETGVKHIFFMPIASREDLAEAHAVVLTTHGHEGKTYWLGGDQAVSFADLALIFSEAFGRKIPLVELSDDEYVKGLVAGGMPEFVAEFLLGWMKGINRGEWDEQSGDLERLLGRKPQTTAQYFKTLNR
jgi:uncharacterized protein YbjT (DUF2867 family)